MHLYFYNAICIVIAIQLYFMEIKYKFNHRFAIHFNAYSQILAN